MEEKIKFGQRVAYGSTDFASNLMWTTVATYLMFFYTDVVGIAAAAVGVLFFAVRIFDAFVDPCVGLIIDKTNSKYGRSRPYFLWMSVPFFIMMFLTFITPSFSDNGKLVYAYITYLILGVVYSFINIPVTSILPRLTKDSNQRTVFGAFRMIGALCGAMFVSIATLPIVDALGGGTSQAAQQTGFMYTGFIYGAAGAAVFIFAFFRLKEKVLVTNKKQSVADSFKALKGNWPWLIIFVLGLIMQVSNMLRSSSGLYFVKYNLGQESLFPLLGVLGLAVLPVFIVTPAIAKRVGKRNAMIYGSLLTAVGYVLLLFFADQSIPMLFIGNAIASLGMGFLGLTFVMISDTVDYGEWKTGIRAEGFLSAASSLGQKVGTGIGGLITGIILAAGGYDGTVSTQIPNALAAIKIDYIVVPLIFTVVSIVLLLFYKLDKQLPKIQEGLQNRHEIQAAETAKAVQEKI